MLDLNALSHHSRISESIINGYLMLQDELDPYSIILNRNENSTSSYEINFHLAAIFHDF